MPQSKQKESASKTITSPQPLQHPPLLLVAVVGRVAARVRDLRDDHVDRRSNAKTKTKRWRRHRRGKSNANATGRVTSPSACRESSHLKIRTNGFCDLFADTCGRQTAIHRTARSKSFVFVSCKTRNNCYTVSPGLEEGNKCFPTIYSVGVVTEFVRTFTSGPQTGFSYSSL